jgi:Response regulator containing a CheY-like receiver domain and an HTH DNA-binding domain
MAPVLDGRISVFLADDNLIVREGVRALLNLESDFEVVGVAGDYDELVSGAEAAAPQVIVTDIRMPPTSSGRASTPPTSYESATPERVLSSSASTTTPSTPSPC